VAPPYMHMPLVGKYFTLRSAAAWKPVTSKIDGFAHKLPLDEKAVRACNNEQNWDMPVNGEANALGGLPE
jgi:hypothetical protein